MDLKWYRHMTHIHNIHNIHTHTHTQHNTRMDILPLCMQVHIHSVLETPVDYHHTSGEE